MIHLRLLAAILLSSWFFSTPLAAQQSSSAPQKPAAEKTKKSPAKKDSAAESAPAKKDPRVLLEGLDAFIAGQMKEWKVPGLSLAVVKDGKVIYAKGYGLRDVKNNLPVTENTLFAIGSCSKSFTAAALGILVDEGKIKWDSPLREYLPDFKMHDDYVTEHMTPRDLVTHRSGLPRHDLLWYGSPFSRRELYDRLRFLEPSAGFRSTYQYQNLMFVTAGYLVEKISGKPWEQFIQERFFAPLEMKSANLSVTVSQKSADFALPYTEEKEALKEVPFRNIDAVGPAGSINSSAVEMANWVILQLSKGKFKDKQVVSEASLGETQSPQITMPGPMQFDEVHYSSYGMGWGITSYRGHVRVTHGGGIDGFTAHVGLFPRDAFGLVMLTNRGGAQLMGILSNNIYDRLLELPPVDWTRRIRETAAKAKEAAEKQKQQADAGRQNGTKPSHPLADYAGNYEHTGYGTLKIELEGENLKLSLHGVSGPLRHFHFDTFQGTTGQLENQKVNFYLGAKGDVERVAVPFEPAVKPIEFARAASGKGPDRAAIEPCIGAWEIPGAPVTLTIRLGGDTFFLLVPGQPEYELSPLKGLEFKLKNAPSGFSIEFKPESSGACNDALLTQPNGTFALKKKQAAP